MYTVRSRFGSIVSKTRKVEHSRHILTTVAAVRCSYGWIKVLLKKQPSYTLEGITKQVRYTHRYIEDLPFRLRTWRPSPWGRLTWADAQAPPPRLAPRPAGKGMSPRPPLPNQPPVTPATRENKTMLITFCKEFKEWTVRVFQELPRG